MKKIIYILAASLAVFSSCEEDLEVGGTNVEAMAGEWWVQADTLYASYFKIMTYNTAENSASQMWIDDVESFWAMKGKVNVDLAGMTFNGESVENEYYDMTFDISNGKIIENAATAPGTGYKTDSIYFQVRFSDEPEILITIAGYRRTGFNEDDH